MRIGPPSGNDNTGMSIELVQLATLRDKVTELTRKAERQALLIEALWQFVKVEFELEDGDLKAMARKLEPVKGDRDSCFWCGHKFPAGLFDS
jgi:hypothetical protein